MDDFILEMRGITKTFPGVKALQDVNLKVRRGEIHSICGENGAGKSTLMKVLSGVYPHGTYEGEIFFDGQVVEFSDIRSSEHRGIVIIHQELALSPYLSIAENIYLGNEVAKRGFIDWNETNHRAAELLARVGLKEGPTTRVMDIGVGKQQLVEIAKALSKEVKLLILDEPTAALNDDDSAHLLNLMRQLKEQGITSIMISHSSTRSRPSPTRSRSSATARPSRRCRARASTRTGSSAAWWGGTWTAATRSTPPPSVRRSSGSRTGRSTTRSSTSAWWSTAQRCPSAAARSWASRASWGRAGPSWR